MELDRYARAFVRCRAVLTERKGRRHVSPVLLQCPRHGIVHRWLVLDLLRSGKIVGTGDLGDPKEAPAARSGPETPRPPA